MERFESEYNYLHLECCLHVDYMNHCYTSLVVVPLWQQTKLIHDMYL